MSVATLLPLLLAFALQDEDAASDPLARAVELFSASEPDLQTMVLRDIENELARSSDAGVRDMVARTERARRELKLQKWTGVEMFDKDVYAPVAAERQLVPADADDAQSAYELMRPWENQPSLHGWRYRYDYASNKAWEWDSDPGPEARLNDYLTGYTTNADVLLAWLESRFDFDKSFDKLADYFNHAYCDRYVSAFPNVTLYDSWASQNGMEMPDTEVIAFAVRVAGDKSFRSPIPNNSKRAQLYDRIRKEFLGYYRHRTWVEAAAGVYLNPECEIRSDHEPLRLRLITSFAMFDSDVEKVRTQFIKAGSRDAYVEVMDGLMEDPKVAAAANAWREARNESRWVVARVAYKVLRRYRLLSDG